ncbi:hypothetical protein MRX96_004130 [Rhipicephalus microplus]
MVEVSTQPPTLATTDPGPTSESLRPIEAPTPSPTRSVAVQPQHSKPLHALTDEELELIRLSTAQLHRPTRYAACDLVTTRYAVGHEEATTRELEPLPRSSYRVAAETTSHGSTGATATTSPTTDDPASNALPTSSEEEMDTPAAARKRALNDDGVDRPRKQESRDNMVMALKTAAADAVRRLSQASRGHAMCTSAPAAAEEEMDMSASRKRPRPQDSSDDEADTRRKLAQGNPKGESDSSADSSDSRLSYDSQHTEDSIDSSASSTTTGVASVIQVDPCTVTMGPPGVPAIDASEGMDEALHHETPCRVQRFPHPLLGASASRPQPRGHPPRPILPSDHAAAPTTETVDHEGFQTVRSKAALRRTRNRTSAALPVDPAVKGTVLYRPASAGGSFQNCPRLTIAQALWLHPGVAAIRVNQHRNVVAVDVTSQECLVKLLALTELKGIPVTTRQPADRRTSMGFIHGVDGDAADENLLSGLQSAVRVLSASREGRTVTLRFEGLVPPRPRDTVPMRGVTSAAPVLVVGAPAHGKEEVRGSERPPGLPPSPVQLARGTTSLEATERHERRAAPSPKPAEDDYQTTISKAARRRAKALEAAAIATDTAVARTVLYCSSTPGSSFTGSPRLTLEAALAKRPGVMAVRVNHRRNIVAADAATPACVTELLSITELSGVPVTARELVDRGSSVCFLHGVDGDLTDSELAAGLVSPVPVLVSNKEGQTVRLRFASSQPPDRVTLCGLQLRVRHARPRQLQCRQCGRFRHVSEACSRAGACIRCGRQHPAADPCRPGCVNCGGGAFS